MIIRPKNWTEFQHYKDRNPSWIKLHKSLLDNYQFFLLQDASKSLAMCLWLLSSEYKDGVIEIELEELSFRFRTDKSKLEKSLNELIKYGFFERDSGVIAECKPESSLEKRREEKEKRRDTPLKRLVSLQVDQQIATDFLEIRKVKRKPLTDTALNKIISQAKKGNLSLNNALKISCEEGWAGFGFEWKRNNSFNATEEPKEPKYDWRLTEEGIEKKAKEIELSRLSGENWKEFRTRIQGRIDETRTH